ncbi:MAG: SMI1/KNR4 family protein [Planctomycetota bacterium]
MQITISLLPYPFPDDYRTPDPPGLAAMRERVHDLLADWKPKREAKSPEKGGYRNHILEVDPNDTDFRRAIQQLKTEVDAAEGMGGMIWREYSPAEKKRFRFDHIVVRSLDPLEEDVYSKPGQWPRLCEACGWIDLENPPTPLRVSREVKKRPKESLFLIKEGFLIARARTKLILETALGDQIKVGPAVIDGQDREALPEAERLFWIWPKMVVGPSDGFTVMETCDACGRPTKAHYGVETEAEKADPDYQDKRLDINQPMVPTLGDPDVHLARLADTFGSMKHGRFAFYHPVLISGPLVKHLKAMKIGPIGYDNRGGCYFSHDLDEPALHPAKPAVKFAKPDPADLEAATPVPKPPGPAPDPATLRQQTEKAWKTIDAWLKKNAPRIAEALEPGADDELIESVEKKLKVSLPEDVKTTYRIHAGGVESDLLPSSEAQDMGFSLLPLDRLFAERRNLRGWPNVEKGWVPIADNGGGDYQCVDVRGEPDDPSTVGRLVEYQHELSDAEPLAKSLADRLTEVAAGLKSGRFGYYEDCGIVLVSS